MRNLGSLPEATREEADKLTEEALQKMKRPAQEQEVEASPVKA